MSLIPIARSTPAPHNGFHRRHHASEYEHDYDATSGRKTQHRHEREHWDRGQQSYQRVINEWTSHAPGVQQCRRSQLEERKATITASPGGVEGRHRSTSSWQQQRHFESSTVHHQQSGARVISSSSMRLIETKVSSSSSSSSSGVSSGWRPRHTVDSKRGDGGGNKTVDRSAPVVTAVGSGNTVVQSFLTKIQHDHTGLNQKGSLIEQFVGSDFGHHAPRGSPPNSSSRSGRESYRSSSSGSSTKKDDLFLAITDLEVSAPLNHAFQLGKKNLSQKGSLSRRRRPSRSNLKANMSEIFQESLDSSRQDTDEEVNVTTIGNSNKLTTSFLPFLNGNGVENRIKSHNLSENSVFTSIKSPRREIRSTNGEMLYMDDTSSRDPDLIRDVKLSQNSVLHATQHPSAAGSAFSVNWLAEAKRNLRKSSSNLFSTNTTTTITYNDTEVDATNSLNRKYSQANNGDHDYYKQKSNSTIHSDSGNLASDLPDLESPRLLFQHNHPVNGKPAAITTKNAPWRVRSQREQDETAKHSHNYGNQSSSNVTQGIATSEQSLSHRVEGKRRTQQERTDSPQMNKSSNQETTSGEARNGIRRESNGITNRKFSTTNGHGNGVRANGESPTMKANIKVASERFDRNNGVETRSGSNVSFSSKTNESANEQPQHRSGTAPKSTITSRVSNGRYRCEEELESSFRSTDDVTKKTNGTNGHSVSNGHRDSNGSKSTQDVRGSVTFLLQDTDESGTDGAETEDGYDDQDYGSSINMMDLEDDDEDEDGHSPGDHSSKTNGKKSLEKNKSKSTSNLDDDETIEAPWFRNSHYRKPEKQEGSRKFAQSSMNLKYVSRGRHRGTEVEDDQATSPAMYVPPGVAPWVHEIKLRTVTPPPPYLRRIGSRSPSNEDEDRTLTPPWEEEERKRRGYTLRSRVAENGAAFNGQMSPPVTVNGQKCKYGEPDAAQSNTGNDMSKSCGADLNGGFRDNIKQYKIQNGDARCGSTSKLRPIISEIENLRVPSPKTSSYRIVSDMSATSSRSVDMNGVAKPQRHFSVNGQNWNYREEVGALDTSGDSTDPEVKLPAEELDRRRRVDWTSLDRPKTESATSNTDNHWLNDVRLRPVVAPRSPSPSRRLVPPSGSPPPATMDLDDDDLTDEEVQRINRPDTPNGYGGGRDGSGSTDRWSTSSPLPDLRPAVVPRSDSVDETSLGIVQLRPVNATSRGGAAGNSHRAESSPLRWPKLRPVTGSLESRQEVTLEFGAEDELGSPGVPWTPNSSFDSDGNWKKPGREATLSVDTGGVTPDWVREAHEKRRSWANLNQIDFELSQRATSISDQSSAVKPPWLDHVIKLKKTPTPTLLADGSAREASTGWKFVGRMSAPPVEDSTSTSVDDEEDTADERSASSGGERRSSSRTPDSQRTTTTAPPPFDVENYVKELITRRKLRGGTSGNSPSPGGAEAAETTNWLQMSSQKAKTDIDWNSLEKSRQEQRDRRRSGEGAEWLETARVLRKSPRPRMTTEERRIVACLRPVSSAGDSDCVDNGRIDAMESPPPPYEAAKSGLKHVDGGGDKLADHRHDSDQPEWMHTLTAVKKVNAVDWTKLDNGGDVDSNGFSTSGSSSTVSGAVSAPWVTQVHLRSTGTSPEARIARPPPIESSFRLPTIDLKPVASPAIVMPCVQSPTAATPAATNGVASTGLKRVTFYIPKARSSPELREEQEVSVERKEPEHPEWVKIAERKCNKAINWEQLDKPQDSVSRSSRDSSGKWITQVHLKHVTSPIAAATVPVAPSGAAEGQPSPPPQLRVRLRHVEPQQRPTRPPMTKSMSYDIGDLRRTTPPRGGANHSAACATNGNGLASSATDKTLYSPQLAKRKLAAGEDPDTPDWMRIAERKRQAQVDWDQLEVSRSSRCSSTSTLVDDAAGNSAGGHDNEDPDEAERSDVFLSLQTSSLMTTSLMTTEGDGNGNGHPAPWSGWQGRNPSSSVRWRSDPQLSVAAPPSQPSWLVQLAERKRAADVDWNNVAKDSGSGNDRSSTGNGTTTTTTSWLQEVRLKSPSLTRLDCSGESSSVTSQNSSLPEELENGGDLSDKSLPTSLPWSTGHSEVDRWQARYKDLFGDLGDEAEEGGAAVGTSGSEENVEDEQKGVNHYCLSPYRKSLRATSLENRQKRRMEMYQRHYSLPDPPSAIPRSVSEMEIIQLERPEPIPETAAEEQSEAGDSQTGSDVDVPIVFVKLRPTDRKSEGREAPTREISPSWLSEIKLRKTVTHVKDNSVRGKVRRDLDPTSTPSTTPIITNGKPKIDIRQSPTEPEPPSNPSFGGERGSPSRSPGRSPSDSFLSIRDVIHRDLKLEVEKREKRLLEISDESATSGDSAPPTPYTACRTARKLETKEQGEVFPARGKPVWLEELKERKVALRSVSVENLVGEVARSPRATSSGALGTGSPPMRSVRRSFHSGGASPNSGAPSFDNVLEQIKSMGKGQLFASLKRSPRRNKSQPHNGDKANDGQDKSSSSSSSSSSKSSSLEDSEEHSLTIGCFKAETICHTSFIIPPEALQSSRPTSRSPSFTVSRSESDFSIIINENPEGEEEDPNDDFLHRRQSPMRRPASVPPSGSFSGMGSPRFSPGGVRRSASDNMSPRVISTIGKLQALNEDVIANRDELESLMCKGTTIIPLDTGSHENFNREVTAGTVSKSADSRNTSDDRNSEDLQSPLLLRNVLSSILGKACSDTNLAAIGVGRTTSAKTRFEATTNRMHASCSDLQSPAAADDDDDSHGGEDRTNSSELGGGGSISETHHLCRSELYIDVLPLDGHSSSSDKEESEECSKADEEVLSAKEELSAEEISNSTSSNKARSESLKEDESSGMSIECTSPEFYDFTETPTNGSGKQYTWNLHGNDMPRHSSSPIDENEQAETVPSITQPLEGTKPSTVVSMTTTTTTTLVTESTEIERETVVEEISETLHKVTTNTNDNINLSSGSEVVLNVEFES